MCRNENRLWWHIRIWWVKARQIWNTKFGCGIEWHAALAHNYLSRHFDRRINQPALTPPKRVTLFQTCCIPTASGSPHVMCASQQRVPGRLKKKKRTFFVFPRPRSPTFYILIYFIFSKYQFSKRRNGIHLGVSVFSIYPQPSPSSHHVQPDVKINKR